MNVLSPANSIFVICCVKNPRINRWIISTLQAAEGGEDDHPDVTGSPQVAEVHNSLVLFFEI